MSFVGWCERCEAEGVHSEVLLCQINFSDAVYMCPRPECLDFLKYAENLDEVFIKRDPSQCVTKAPASELTKAIKSSSLSTVRLSSSSSLAPLPTEGGPLSRAVGDQDTARDPAAHPSSKEEVVGSSVWQMASTSNSEAKAGDASEVCRGGKMLVAEAVTLPVPTGVEPFFHGSVVHAMPVASATRREAGAAEKELSLLRVGSADVAGNPLEQIEPCMENAPPAKSHASGERSSLPVATCGGREEEVVLQELAACVEKGTGPYDLSVSSYIDAGECISEVFAEDPITLFSLQCGHPQAAKPSVDGGDSTTAWSQPQGASGVQFYSTEDAFRDGSPTDCMEIEEGAHQSQSEGRQYVDLGPRPPPLLAPSQGALSSEQSDGTTLQAAAVVGPSAAPVWRTPAVVAQGNAAVTRPVGGRASTGKYVIAGTSSGSGRRACKLEVRGPDRWTSSGHKAATSDPARSTTLQKRGASPPRPQAEATAPSNASSYVVHKLAMITEALKLANEKAKDALSSQNNPEKKRVPRRKRRKEGRMKRQRPASPKKVLRLAFGRPPQIRRKRKPEQAVPDVLHPTPNPTPSDNSSKPSINCLPASCVTSGSDLSITNPGSSSTSFSSSSLQLMDCYAWRSTASGFPPYQFKEIAPMTVTKRGRRPAKKGAIDADIGAQ